MKFGKREQIVVIVLSALGTIGLLHWTIYSDHSALYRAAYKRADELAPDAGNVVKIASKDRFSKFKTMTGELQTEYNNDITSLRLTRPDVFTLAAPAAKAGGPAQPAAGPSRPGGGGGAKPGGGPAKPGGGPAKPGGPAAGRPGAARPAQGAARRGKEAAGDEPSSELVSKQIQLIIDEIRTLRKFDERVAGSEAGKVKALFLGEGLGRGGWNLAVKLPEKIYSDQVKDIGRLVDSLREAAQTKGMLEVIAPDQTELRAEQRGYYEGHLAALGIDNKIYKDASPGSLASMGEYLPLIHKLNHAILVLDALSVDPDREISGKKITREGLYDWLEIKLPVRPMGDLKVPELYFVYEELRSLNTLLRLMNEEMKDDKNPLLFGVKFEDASYLTQMDALNLAGPEAKAERKQAASLTGNAGAAGAAGSLPQTAEKLGSRVVQPPDENDVGICLPVVLQFRSSNINAWNFIYRVLADFPLVELDEVTFRAVQEGGDVYCQVKFLIVPYLFAIEGGGPRPKPPPAPRPAAPAARPAAPVASKLLDN